MKLQQVTVCNAPIIDKSKWGEGPWQHEPDEVLWEDKETGLPCKIIRHSLFGHLCGYVGLTEEHPAYGMTYDPIHDFPDANTEWWRRHVTHRVEYRIKDIQVHGGLTYAGGFEQHVGYHWFGFDGSHWVDFQPGITNDTKTYIYRDIEFVTKEVENLARQLAAIKKEDV